MKKNDYLLLAATAAYSFLFYRQSAGINFTIFSVVLLSVLAMKNSALPRNPKWLWAAFLCLLSAVCVFIHSSALSIFANLVSLLLVSAFSFNVATSSLFSFFFAIYSLVSSLIFMILDAISRWTPVPGQESHSRKGMKIIATTLVLLLSMLFFSMYKSSNPLFAENTKWINFDFISIEWICFTLGGLLLMYGLFYSRSIAPVEQWENQLRLANEPAATEPLQAKRYDTERYAGLLLFVILNLMLVILNVGDVQTLYFHGGLPANMSHSDFVHHGVGILILSILIATGLIMYLNRKEFGTVKNDRALMAFIYLWIFQNLLMLSSTALRNGIYIHDYNFTYKRIGVYVWLLLAMCGLGIMFWKILKKRSNWYLVRSNIALWFTVLSLSATVNWDKLITRYNISNKPLAEVDFYYLLDLSEANIPELLEVAKKPEFALLNARMKNYSGTALSRYHDETFVALLHVKVYRFMANYCSDWRSDDLRNRGIIASLYP